MPTTLNKRIKFLRNIKGWTQEDMAEKLKMSVIGYGNIERGDADIALSRLEEIAKLLGVELQELFNSQGKIVINLGDASITNGYYHGESTHQDITYIHKELEYQLEKDQLIIEQLKKEVSFLQQEVTHLKEIIELLKK
jgi:transcriptional regulator with XRE-family HTH domain